MRLTSSDRARFEPGTLRRWQLIARGEMVRSSAPPSENERFHLDSVERGEPGWIALSLEFPRALDLGVVQRATAAVLDRHDVLRGHFVAGDDGYHRYVHPHIEVRADPGTAGGPATGQLEAEFSESIMAEITAVCCPLRPAAHYVAAISRPHSTTLLYAFDHCYIDARSLAVLAAELSAVIAGRQLGAPTSGLAVIERVAEHDIGVSPTDSRLLGWREFLDGSGWTAPEFPLDLGVEPGSTAPTHTQVRTLRSAAQAAEFSEVLRRHGGRSYAALLTCAGIAIHRAGGPAQMPVVIPTGGNQRSEECVAWLVGNAPVRIDCSDADLASSVAHNTQRLIAALPLADIGLAPVYQAFGDKLRINRRDVFMMSYVDYTRMHPVDGGIGVQQISSDKSADTAQWWFWRDREGVHVRVRHPRTETAVRLITQILDTTTEIVDNVVPTYDPVATNYLA
ncbi:condensation domain-containing protein [Gordonia bronchialis]|uniref:condensation domain-containing protein n=1 Tax=Gordonia bronchialis TaxID=2054 RepID=UPI0022712D0F|nr:condensation domain-containing protein [Gordonia bronchialis]